MRHHATSPGKRVEHVADRPARWGLKALLLLQTTLANPQELADFFLSAVFGGKGGLVIEKKSSGW